MGRSLSRQQTGFSILALWCCVAGVLLTASCGGEGSGENRPSEAPGNQIHLIGNRIVDKAGKPVVARGPECVVADADYVDSIDTIAATGANAVRILLTLDAANGMTPEAFDAVIARAVSHRMVIWVSLYSWDDGHNNPINAALGGGNFYALKAPAGTPACSRSRPGSCYLAVWNRQWMKDLIGKYRSNIIIDAAQEYIGTGDASSAAGRKEWADAAVANVAFFRRAGYEAPLEIMSNFQGRDLAAIVEYGSEIRAADTLTYDGYPQTMFGWQAYWAGDWYPAWQGELLLGKGKTLSATEAIRRILPAQAFPIQSGFDNYPGDASTQYEWQINEAATNHISWLWWSWNSGAGTVDCPETGAACASFVTDDPNGFAGAAPLTP